MIDKQSVPSNRYIEKTANDTITRSLRDLFLLKHRELGENKTDSSQDWGIDYYIEVFDKETKRELLFLIQCKGTNGNLNFKKDNTFSFQMSIRHANYFYYELSEPLIFFVCDIQSTKVYWYPVQLDHQLEDRIITQTNSNIESLKVNISTFNILNEENFERFLTDLENSRKSQIHKNKLKINNTSNYDFIYQSVKQLNIVDAFVKILDLYRGINVFPTFIINKIFAFISIRTSLSGDILTTDNEIFFDFFQNLNLSENTISFSTKFTKYKNVDDLENKLLRIIEFFELNLINHIDWQGPAEKEQTRICVHDLFISNDCKCERCTYKKLDLVKTSELLEAQNNNLKQEDKLKKAYSFFLMSDYEKSFREYSSLLKEISRNDNPGIYITAKYNLLQLKTLISNNVFSSSREEILKELDKQNFVLDEIILPGYFHDFLKLTKENRLVPNSVLSIDSILTDIQNMWLEDQLGGSSNNSFSRTIITEFLRTYYFIEYNLLIYNEYREFEILVNKLLEGIFAMHSIKNPISSKYGNFETTIIDMWLFHAEPAHVQKLLKKYRVKSIKLAADDSLLERLSLYIDNLTASASLIESEFVEKNHSHNKKISRIIENYLLIISAVKIEDESRNILLNKYLILIVKLNHWYFTSFEYLHVFLNTVSNISTENLQKIIAFVISYEKYNYGTFSLAVTIYAAKFPKGQLLENELKSILSIKKFNPEDFYHRNKFSGLISIIPKLTDTTQNRIRNYAAEKLHVDFRSSNFFSFTILDIIEYDAVLMQQYIDATPDYTKEPLSTAFFYGKKETRNYYLEKLISLFFKFDLEFTEQIRSLSSKALDQEYYNWLMNLNGFDYTKFNSYWVLYNKSSYYMKAFKGSPMLQKHLAAALKENYIEGVAKVYLEIIT
ncbi:DUF4365 domain-containing protein [Flavobacterium notoginsengisoli]|uniref:DUF4365 domain-containing protein n=1 Tax=Flavobacterium notoginsengisoli TaxID=1478199 RepID=UPI0036345BBF